MKPKDQWLTMGAIALVVVAGLHSCGDSSSEDVANSLSAASRAAVEAQARKDANESPAAEPASKADQVRAKIEDYAVDEYTADEFPTVVKNLGKKGAKDAQAGAYAAAYRAAQSPSCDRVNAASIVIESTKKNMKFFANCANAKQWHFTAAELKDSAGHWYTADNAPAAGISDTDRRAKEREELQSTAPGGVMECEEQLKRRLQHPASADFHSLMGSANVINNDLERVVQVEFEVTNSFNAEIPYTGQCIFHRNGKVSVDIFNR